jgi:hypothetical protein
LQRFLVVEGHGVRTYPSAAPRWVCSRGRFDVDANEPKAPAKPKYEAPKVQASYTKEELEALISAEGSSVGGGCGCGAT